jgi:predicted permease
MISSAPFDGPNSALVFVRVDRPLDRSQAPDADYRIVSPGLLSALGIPLRRGRDISFDDRLTSPPVALISETMAREQWQSGDPIGKSIRVGDVEKGPEFTIIGVVGDVRFQSLETTETRATMYFAAAQSPRRGMTFALRGGQPAALQAGVRSAIASLDPAVPTPRVVPLQERLALAFATPRFAVVLFGTFAGAAVVLAVIGMYGVMSYLVRQRSHEIGIRIALGAPARTLMTSVMSRALRLTLIGVALGLFGARLLTGLITRLLFGVQPTDAVTFAALATLLVGVGVIASVVPARRATRANPLAVLRGEGA